VTPARPSAARLWLATVDVLWRRDVVRFFRQKSRVLGALVQPLIFWLGIGSGLSASFRIPGAERISYLEYFFPGVVLMVVLFTSIFTTMSLIEDRHQGFLQAVLVAPSSESAVVLGKTLGGTTIALIQAGLFVAMAPLAGFPAGQISWGMLAAVLVGSSVGLTAIGFAVAWWLDSVQGYHAIMSVLLIPLWVLSGALFPGRDVGWMRVLMKLNPLSYAAEGVRRAFYGGDLPAGVGIVGSSAVMELAVVLALAVLGIAAASAAARRRA
jgi:ABC-2 type transport system permease protein